MKKMMMAAMAVALIAGATSCKKDKDNDRPNGGEAEYVTGIFNPSKHIKSVMGPEVAQNWSWDGSSLSSIVDNVNQSNYSFTYKGSGRQGVVDYRDTEKSRRYTYSYDDGTLDNIEFREDNQLMYNGQAYYADGKLSHMNYTNLSTKFMLQTANQQLGLNLPTESTISMPNPSFTVDYTWSGDNITSEKINVTLNGTVGVQELFDLFGSQLGGGLGSYAAILPLIIQSMGDMTANFTITINRNEAYTYDSKKNPFYGFWGDGLLFNTQVLSKNNMLTSKTTGNVRFQSQIRITLPEQCPEWLSQYASMWAIVRAFLNNRELPVDQTLPLDNNQSFTFKYNGDNYPTQATDSDGQTFSYGY